MTVKIMSRKDLMELARVPFPADVAVISITDSDDEDVELLHQPEHLLRLKYDDVSDEIFEQLLGRKPTIAEMRRISSRLHMISNAQIQQIAEFVISRNNTGTLICQCEYGQSRSAAIAAAVEEYYHRRGVRIFADTRYYPNKYIFRKLLKSLQACGPKYDKIRGGAGQNTAAPKHNLGKC